MASNGEVTGLFPGPLLAYKSQVRGPAEVCRVSPRPARCATQTAAPVLLSTLNLSCVL